MRLTKGPINPNLIPETDEAYFYSPNGSNLDWPEPMVFAVTQMARELDPYVNGGREGLPDGVVIKPVPIDPAQAERLVVTGTVERPLITEAHWKFWEDPGGIRLHFMAIHGIDPGGGIRATLIDGAHSYRASYERGEKEVLVALMAPAFWRRFLIGGIPEWVISDCLPKGEGDTSRYDYEIATGRRRA